MIWVTLTPTPSRMCDSISIRGSVTHRAQSLNLHIHFLQIRLNVNLVRNTLGGGFVKLVFARPPRRALAISAAAASCFVRRVLSVADARRYRRPRVRVPIPASTRVVRGVHSRGISTPDRAGSLESSGKGISTSRCLAPTESRTIRHWTVCRGGNASAARKKNAE